MKRTIRNLLFIAVRRPEIFHRLPLRMARFQSFVDASFAELRRLRKTSGALKAERFGRETMDSTQMRHLWNRSGSQFPQEQRRVLACGLCICTLFGINFSAHANGSFTAWNVNGLNSGEPTGKLVGSFDRTTVYGITYPQPGNQYYGTVFKLEVASGTCTTIHTFGGPDAPSNDGHNPIGGLVLSPDGWLYGVTTAGGSANRGTVFAVSINDDGSDKPVNGSPTYHVVYSFLNGKVPTSPGGSPTVQDGSYPTACLTPGLNFNKIGSAGVLYGTTTDIGNYRSPSATAFGTVFGMQVLNGQMVANSYYILHTFSGSPDGEYPFGDLVYDEVNGWLYGTTEEGGNQGGPTSYGTVFVVNTSGSVYSIIWDFHGQYSGGLQAQGDSGYPITGLVLANNWLYGTTASDDMGPIGTYLNVSTGNYYAPGPGPTVFGLELNPSANPPAVQLDNNRNPVGWSVPIPGISAGDLCFQFTPIDAGPQNVLIGTIFTGASTTSAQTFYSGTSMFEIKTDHSWSDFNFDFDNVTLSTSSPLDTMGVAPYGGMVLAPLQFLRFPPNGGPTYFATDYAFLGTTVGGPNAEGTVFEYNVVPGLDWQREGTFRGNPIFGLVWEDPPNLILQSAPSVTGPWTNILGATSPYTNATAGSQQFFRLMASVTNLPTLPPYVVTSAPSGIAPGSATLWGQILPNGANSTVWFEYGTGTNYGTFTASTFVSATNGMLVSNTITGLTLGQTYHYQLFATNTAGISPGGDMTFTVLPSATTLWSSFIDPTDVVLYGSVSPDGFGWDCGPNFEYGVTTNYGGYSSEDFVSATNAGSIIVTNIIGDLEPGTLYHYQFVGVFFIPEPFPDPEGFYLAYGGDRTFTTPGTPINTQVVPNADANLAGNSNNGYPFIGANTMRYQQVYATSQFGAVPTGGAYITAITFRLPTGWGSFSNTLSAIQIDLSTTTNAPGGLSSTFAANVGTNDTTVFNGPVSLSSADIGSPPDFDILIPLTTPFFYNPSAGNLLLDVRNPDGGTTTQFDADSSGEYMSRVFGDVSSSTAYGGDNIGLITEFLFSSQ